MYIPYIHAYYSSESDRSESGIPANKEGGSENHLQLPLNVAKTSTSIYKVHYHL